MVLGELKHLDLDPEPADLPADPARFRTTARLLVGPVDGPGEEWFEVTVCSPEWLAVATRRSGGIYDARHHVVVSVDDFDRRTLEDWLAARVEQAQGDTWSDVAERVSRIGYWEFEDHRA